MAPSVYSLDWQVVQVRRSLLGISPAFGQFWQLPLLVNWCDGQAVQLRASAFGTSPAFGQSSQLPFLVIWFAGHSTVKAIICTYSSLKISGLVLEVTERKEEGIIKTKNPTPPCHYPSFLEGQAFGYPRVPFLCVPFVSLG